MSDYRYFKVSIPRRKVVSYERNIAARTAEEAIALVQRGTAWPQSYDELTIECVDGEPIVEDVTTPELIEYWGDPNDPTNMWRGDR